MDAVVLSGLTLVTVYLARALYRRITTADFTPLAWPAGLMPGQAARADAGAPAPEQEQNEEEER
jgi:hypothetical protein